MSISIILAPIAIALVTTATANALSAAAEKTTQKTLGSIETVFNDYELLHKTLQDHGLPVERVSDSRLAVKSGKYELLYERPAPGGPFYVSASGWESAAHLIADITCLENEYRSNVQSYTYNKLLQNLSESGMTVEEETVLEDNSIVLTIAV